MKFFNNFLILMTFALNCCLYACGPDDMAAMAPVVTGVVNVGTDNLGNPVELAFRTKGKNDGRPVIVFSDPYMGIDSWRAQQRIFSKNCFTIALDPIGFGLSSKNDPTALDGVNGHTGYSYRQQASFLHKLLESLDPQGPIIFVPVDIQGQVGIWYLTDYQNDPYAITKMFMEEATSASIVSDDPCSVSNVNSATAQQFVGLFALDPATAAALMLSDVYKTTSCPQIEPILLSRAIDYVLTTTPEIMERLFLGTFTENVSHLMADITVPVSNTFGTATDSDTLVRRNVGITFFGHGCLKNPYIAGDCTECTQNFVEPFPNSQFLTYSGHGIVVHLTACRKFKRDLKDFIKDNDASCGNCFPLDCLPFE